MKGKLIPEASSRAPSGSTHLHLAIIYAWPYDIFCTEIQIKMTKPTVFKNVTLAEVAVYGTPFEMEVSVLYIPFEY